MISYELHTFALNTGNDTKAMRSKLIRDIYKDVLWEDPSWHFFYEEEQGDIIRCSPEFSSLVEEYLTQYPVKFVKTPYWKEDLVIVVDNMDYFESLFHLNSKYIVTQMLDINKDPRNLWIFVDRQCHSLYLNYNFMEDPSIWVEEERLLYYALAARAGHTALRNNYLESIKEKTNVSE